MKVYGIYRGHPEGYSLETPLYLNQSSAMAKARELLETAIKENEASKKFCIEDCEGLGLEMYPDWKQESETSWSGGFEASIEVAEVDVVE